MLRTFVMTALTFVLSCSSGVTKSPGGQSTNDAKPASFAQYKQWRQRNDPAGQVYADFKQWQAAYNEWRQQQSQRLGEGQLK